MSQCSGNEMFVEDQVYREVMSNVPCRKNRGAGYCCAAQQLAANPWPCAPAECLRVNQDGVGQCGPCLDNSLTGQPEPSELGITYADMMSEEGSDYAAAAAAEDVFGAAGVDDAVANEFEQEFRDADHFGAMGVDDAVGDAVAMHFAEEEIRRENLAGLSTEPVDTSEVIVGGMVALSTHWSAILSERDGTTVWRRSKIPEDGHCFFRAVARAVNSIGPAEEPFFDRPLTVAVLRNVLALSITEQNWQNVLQTYRTYERDGQASHVYGSVMTLADLRHVVRSAEHYATAEDIELIATHVLHPVGISLIVTNHNYQAPKPGGREVSFARQSPFNYVPPPRGDVRRYRYVVLAHDSHKEHFNLLCNTNAQMTEAVVKSVLEFQPRVAGRKDRFVAARKGAGIQGIYRWTELPRQLREAYEVFLANIG